MRKYLYGTTALAAAGLLAGPAFAEAEPLHMELGGYFQQLFGYSNADKNSAGATTVNEGISYKNAEVYFKMRGELDNGLKVGGRLELEGDNSGDQIDQAYLTLDGGFGSLRLGAINSGRYSYGWNTDAPQYGSPINSGWVSTYVPAQAGAAFRFRSPSVSTVIDIGNDDERITYFTPRFNGFQFALSWAPNATGTGGESLFDLVDERTGYTNAIDLGVSYSGEFDGVGLEVQAGIFTADAPDVADKTDGRFDDYFGYNGGVAVSSMGFTIAGSFAVVEDGLAIGCSLTAGTCTTSNEGESFSAGVGYETGPWGFSLTYFNGQEENLLALPGDAENEFFSVAASYTLGPGLRTAISVNHASIEGDAAGSADDNEGTAVLVGVFASF